MSGFLSLDSIHVLSRQKRMLKTWFIYIFEPAVFLLRTNSSIIIEINLLELHETVHSKFALYCFIRDDRKLSGIIGCGNGS